MSAVSPQAGSPGSDSLSVESKWERGYERVAAQIPYGTLLIGTVLSLLGAQTWGERAGTVGLVVAAGAWTLVAFTSLGTNRRHRQGRVRLYFAGFLVLAMLLMVRDPVFFVFVVTGFFHAYLLRPWSVAFLGVGATSLVVNSMIVISEPTAEAWSFYVLIVVVQTTAIGFGLIGGEKLTELSEQRRRAVADLQAALDENAGLHAQLVAQAREAGVLDERQRMAREIHDTLAQGLTGVITQLEAAHQSRDHPAALDRHVDNAARLARDTLAEARRSVEALQPASLDNSRLPEALAEVTARWSELSSIPVEMATTGTARSLHPEVEVTLLRIAQEGLANIAKHAAASRVGVTLSFMEDLVTLDVRDDGVGIATDTAASGESGSGGFGLNGMRQRVEGLAGTIGIESEVGEGTAISVSIPALSAGTGDG